MDFWIKLPPEVNNHILIYIVKTRDKNSLEKRLEKPKNPEICGLRGYLLSVGNRNTSRARGC